MSEREHLEHMIAVLETKVEAAHHRAFVKRAKETAKERKARFKIEAYKRAHLHTTLNRYAIGR